MNMLTASWVPGVQAQKVRLTGSSARATEAGRLASAGAASVAPAACRKRRRSSPPPSKYWTCRPTLLISSLLGNARRAHQISIAAIDAPRTC